MKMILQPFQVPSNPANPRARNIVRLEFALIGADMFGNRICSSF
jgi:hypothetical protein